MCGYVNLLIILNYQVNILCGQIIMSENLSSCAVASAVSEWEILHDELPKSRDY